MRTERQKTLAAVAIARRAIADGDLARADRVLRELGEDLVRVERLVSAATSHRKTGGPHDG